MNFPENETNLKTPFLDKHSQSEPYITDAEALTNEYPKISYESTNSPSLNEINYVNLCTFLINFTVTYLVGVKGVGTFLSNRELAEKYQVSFTLYYFCCIIYLRLSRLLLFTACKLIYDSCDV